MGIKMQEAAENTGKGLAFMREPFPDHQVSKLPKGTQAQNKCPAEEKRNCAVCGGWHHPKIRHLDYVGHAAVTDRLLDCDPAWSWEPLAIDEKGFPRFDESGGLWIRLTVCGVTRLGYGNAIYSANKDVGSREKEVIGDAIRNAAMRFGAALEMWHKGDLHLPEPAEEEETKIKSPKPLVSITMDEAKAMVMAEYEIDPNLEDEINSRGPDKQPSIVWKKATLVDIEDEPLITPGAIKIVLMKMKIAGMTNIDLQAKFGVSSVEKLKQSQVNAVLAWLKA
jgi:hypothetical protein